MNEQSARVESVRVRSFHVREAAALAIARLDYDDEIGGVSGDGWDHLRPSTQDWYLRLADAALNAADQLADSPEDFVLVPREPTPDMLVAAALVRDNDRRGARRRPAYQTQALQWRAMIDAAPIPPAPSSCQSSHPPPLTGMV